MTMTTAARVRLTELANCAGCAAKMGPATLQAVLQPLAATFGAMATPDLLVGLGTADDAAVYRLNDDLALVATVDFFPPMVDDPATFGAIAATNAISDVYAMGGRPLLALNIVAFPDTLDGGILTEILRGGAEQAQRAGVMIAGGHSVIDAEPKYGLAVIGTVQPSEMVRKGGAVPGDVLILTKRIGTGLITTALKRGAVTAESEAMTAAVTSMTTHNGPTLAVVQRLRRAGMLHLHAGTDVTGFGVLGHLWEMLAAGETPLGARVAVADVPLLPEARALAIAGTVPGGTGRNMTFITPHVRWGKKVTKADRAIMADPQTAGGLLLAVPATEASLLLTTLAAEDLPAWQIGEVTDAGLMEVR
jgi:selenide,water dikinase